MLNLVTLADASHHAPEAAWLDAAAARGTPDAEPADAGATASLAADGEWAAVAHALDADDGSSYVGLARAGDGVLLVVKLPVGGGQVTGKEGGPCAGATIAALPKDACDLLLSPLSPTATHTKHKHTTIHTAAVGHAPARHGRHPDRLGPRPGAGRRRRGHERGRARGPGRDRRRAGGGGHHSRRRGDPGLVPRGRSGGPGVRDRPLAGHGRGLDPAGGRVRLRGLASARPREGDAA
jgi:hypothetical protein